MKTLIFETKNFGVYTARRPHVSREEGGHLVIKAKREVESRIDLTKEEACEVMLLSMLVGEAMQIGLQKRNINIQRINYQENGNWAYNRGEKPFFHLHLYGRTPDSKIQKWGQALYFPDENSKIYDSLTQLDEKDIESIQTEIYRLLKEDKYSSFTITN